MQSLARIETSYNSKISEEMAALLVEYEANLAINKLESKYQVFAIMNNGNLLEIGELEKPNQAEEEAIAKRALCRLISCYHLSIFFVDNDPDRFPF